MDTDIDPTGEPEGATNGFLQETGAFNKPRDLRCTSLDTSGTEPSMLPLRRGRALIRG